MSSTQKKPKKSRKICTWIRERTSPYCFGIETKAGKPAHCNKNDDILYHFQCLRMGWFKRHLSRLKNTDYADHFSNRKTFYFTSDGRSSVPEVLVNIDIDCHGAGSLEGAIAFAEHLKATKFPDFYFEESTNGNGVHGYILVAKGDLGDEGLNSALTVLDRWLKAELSKGEWDVEDVEVKGQAPEFGWGREKFMLRTYKSGQLAKLPREALSRSEELLGTTRVRVDELRRLKVPAMKVESGNSVVSMKKRAAKVESLVSIIPEEDEASKAKSVVSVVPEEEEAAKVESVVSSKAVKLVPGSIVGRHFDEEELAKLGGSYLSLARGLLGGEVLVAKGRRAVKEEDLAVFLMLLRFFTNNMNVDGSLPVARWREMWRALHESGDIERAWCHNRFARLRNFLTDNDLLSWQEEDFVVGVFDDEGRFVPGRAAKWRASEELMAMMVDVVSQDVEQVVDIQDRGREMNSVIVCNTPGDKQDEVKEEGEGTLYVHTPVQPFVLPPSLGQSKSFLNEMDRLGIVIPPLKPRFAGYSTGRYRMAA